MRATGLQTSHTAAGDCPSPMASATLVNGTTASKTDLGSRHGPMDRGTKVSIAAVVEPGVASYAGQTEVSISENSVTTRCRATARSNGKQGRTIADPGNLDECTESEYLNGQMGRSITVHTSET